MPKSGPCSRPPWTCRGGVSSRPSAGSPTPCRARPLTYLPGQHISVQTPHWPRLWRTYSIANAPRPDGLLRLHVRVVTGGLVSPGLVHQVRAGDPPLLGAPAGALIADTKSDRDVLCLAR